MKYCVTVAKTGCLFVEADNKEQAIDIANHQTTDSVNWSDDWKVTDCSYDDNITPEKTYINKKDIQTKRFHRLSKYNIKHLYIKRENI